MYPVTILVTYKAKNGERYNFVNTIAESGILGKIREEKGCISYNYYYSADNEDTVLLIEKWEDIESQKRHMQQPHMEELKDIKEKYILNTKVEIAGKNED